VIATRDYTSQALGLTFSAAAPAEPLQGAMYYDTSQQCTKIYHAGQWLVVAAEITCECCGHPTTTNFNCSNCGEPN